MVENNNFTLGNYVIVKLIGEGAFGFIYFGRHITTGTNYALKLLRKEKEARDGLNIELFQLEARLLMNLNHNRILRCEDKGYALLTDGQSQSYHYMCLELAERGNFFNFLAPRGGKKLPEPVARAIFHQIYEGIEYIHEKNVANRDLKPENILVTGDYDIKISDFGFAREFESKDERSTEPWGSQGYKAPEVERKDYNPFMADVFSLGIILFALVTARSPFETQGVPLIYNQKYSKVSEFKFEGFWKQYPFCEKLSNGFKELCYAMILPEKERITLKEIKSSKWFKGKVATKEDVVECLCKYQNQTIYDIVGTTRGASRLYPDEALEQLEEHSEDLNSKARKEETAEPIDSPLCINLGYYPKEILILLCLYAKINKKIITLSKTEFKAKIISSFEMEHEKERDSGPSISTEIEINIFIDKNFKTFAIFKKASGDYLSFIIETSKIMKFLNGEENDSSEEEENECSETNTEKEI